MGSSEVLNINSGFCSDVSKNFLLLVHQNEPDDVNLVNLVTWNKSPFLDSINSHKGQVIINAWDRDRRNLNGA